MRNFNNGIYTRDTSVLNVLQKLSCQYAPLWTVQIITVYREKPQSSRRNNLFPAFFAPLRLCKKLHGLKS